LSVEIIDVIKLFLFFAPTQIDYFFIFVVFQELFNKFDIPILNFLDFHS
jgi:hypothetical protein